VYLGSVVDFGSSIKRKVGNGETKVERGSLGRKKASCVRRIKCPRDVWEKHKEKKKNKVGGRGLMAEKGYLLGRSSESFGSRGKKGEAGRL